MGVFSPASPLTLSLEDAIERGIENSLSLKTSLIDLSIAEYSANRLWSEVFPTISGNLSASFASPVFSDSSPSGSYYMNAGVSLALNAGIPYAMKNIKLAYQAKLLSYEDARNQLAIQLTKSFYGLSADRDNLAVLADMLNLAQAQYERDQVAFRNGRIGEIPLMRSQLALENARYNLNAVTASHARRMGDFLVQLGLDHDEHAALEGKIETVKAELDTERLILENLFRRPDIVSRRREIERLENAEKQTAYSVRAPSLSLLARWRASNFSPFTDSLSGSATVNIHIDPWIPGTARNKSVRNARLEIEKARIDLQAAEESAAANIRSLAVNLNSSWNNIEIARLGLAIAQRNFQLTEQGFRSGTVQSSALESAQNDLAGARQRLLQSELSYFNIILDISAALNIKWRDLLQ
jgi:outer membrane protein TolC